MERPASARFASYGAVQSAVAHSAKAEAECGIPRVVMLTRISLRSIRATGELNTAR